MKHSINDLEQWKHEYKRLEMGRLSSVVGIIILIAKLDIDIDRRGSSMSFFLGRMIEKKVISRVMTRTWGLIDE